MTVLPLSIKTDLYSALSHTLDPGNRHG